VLRRLGRDVAIYGAADFVFRFVAFAVFPIYAHVFTVEQFGTYALILAAVGIVALLANLGVNNATQRYYWDPQTELATQPTIVSTGLGVLLTWSCLLVLALIAALYPVREVIATRYGISWTIVIVALATIVPDQLLQYCLDTLRLHFTPWRFVFVSFMKNLLGVATGLVLILAFGAGLEGLFIGALVGAVVAVPIALILIRRDLTLGFNALVARRLVSFGYPFIFAGLAYWLFGAVDRWMLAELSTAKELGLYAIAYKFGSAVVFLNTAFGQAWSPLALKIRRDDEHYRTAYARVFSVWLFVLLVAGSIVALFGQEVLRILTPTDYWEAAPVLAILVMGIVVSGTTQITAVGISIEKQTRLFAWAAWTTASVNVLLNLALIPTFGAIGAALATFVSYVLLTALYLFWSQRLHPIPLEKSRLVFLAVVIVAMVAASSFITSVEVSARMILLKAAILGLIVAGALSLRIVNIPIIRGVFRDSPKS
jgi:O-antigen/teichoic acid export membrane protein